VALAARLRSTGLSSPSAAIWIATAGLFLVSIILAPNTATPNAILGILPFAAILALAGIGQTLVVQQRGLDLTVAAMITLSAILITKIPNGNDALLPVALAVVAVVAVGAGLLSGLSVTRLWITPVVATLGVGALLSGLTLQVTGGAFSTTAAPALDAFAFGKTFGIPNTVIVAVVAVAIASVVVRSTVIGRWFVAVGANPEAAVAAGLPVDRIRVATYVLASLAYAFTGVILAGFVGTPGLAAGDGYLLATVAAVVLGGTSLAGGNGSVIATAGGAIFLTQLSAVVLGMGAPPSAQLILEGTIIALGMGLRNVPWHRFRRAAASSGRGPSVDGTTPPSNDGPTHGPGGERPATLTSGLSPARRSAPLADG
jgi:ribose transport system permease protein